MPTMHESGVQTADARDVLVLVMTSRREGRAPTAAAQKMKARVGQIIEKGVVRCGVD